MKNILESVSLISIIVATHNYGEFIGNTFKSLISQTYQNWECIVIDDGSTDDTKEIILDFAKQDERIKYFYQKNQGTAVARNNGLDKAKGDFIQFLDADDLIESRKFEIQVNYLIENPNVDLVYSGVRYFNAENPLERFYSMGNENRLWMPEISGSGKLLCQKLITKNIMAISSPLLRKQVINIVGEFDLNLYIEDWDYWIRCGIAGLNFKYLPAEETLSLIRIHSSSKTHNAKNYFFEREKIRRKIDNSTLDKEALRLNRFLWSIEGTYIGVDEFRDGNRWKGLSKIIKYLTLSRSGLWHILKSGIERRIFHCI